MKKEESFLDLLLQLPSDIKNEYKNSKFPKFIIYFLIRRDIKKAFKIIDRFTNENIIIDKSTLDQYLCIIENDFKPEANYGILKNVEYIDVNSVSTGIYRYITANIIFDDFKAKIRSRDTEKSFEVEIIFKEEIPGKEIPQNKSYTFIGNNMICKVIEYSDFISRINNSLLKDISTYFKDYLRNNCFKGEIYDKNRK